jgi:cob(I)alamin adenosyltransferase
VKVAPAATHEAQAVATCRVVARRAGRNELRNFPSNVAR